MHAYARLSVIAALLLPAACAIVRTQPIVLPLWPKGAPGQITQPRYREDTVYTNTGAPRIRHVTKPELYVYLPRDSAKVHAAVVVCPGGGYIRLSLGHEGFEAAEWLASSGVAGIVLKYRLPSDSIMRKKSEGPLQDVQEAIRVVRRMAREWRIDPNDVGVMGFSAGGHLAGSASTLFDYPSYLPYDSTSARPDFSILLYGVLSMENQLTHKVSRTALLGDDPDDAEVELLSAERQVTARTPPAFLVHAANDSSVSWRNSLAYYEALKAHGVRAEMHLYETGGHGFGLARASKGTESGWPDACLRWMRAGGWIK